MMAEDRRRRVGGRERRGEHGGPGIATSQGRPGPDEARPRRAGLALALVLAAVALAFLSVGSLFLMMRSGLKRTTFIRTDTEHLYLAEAVFANTHDRLTLKELV